MMNKNDAKVNPLMKKNDAVHPKGASFLPFGKRCLIIPTRVSTETESGIILAIEAQQMPEGEVWEVGDTCESVKKGDYVTFASHAGHTVTTDGVDCVVILEDDIVGRHLGPMS